MNEELRKKLTTDIELKEASKPIKFMPYIGKEYFDLQPEHRVMILGESFYGIDWKVDEDAPSNVAADTGKKFLKNALLAVCGKSVNSKVFWDKVVFTNCVQRAMMDITFRPSSADFWQGAHFIAEQIKVLKPALVISAANSDTVVHYLKVVLGIEGETITKNKVGRITPKVVQGKDLKLVFIKHFSSYFSWPSWHKFLEEEAKETISFFKDLEFSTA